MDLLVNVSNQKIKLVTNLQYLVEGTQRFVRFVFDLSEEWDDLTVFAQFTQNGNSYNQFLDSDNSVYLPAEIVAGECTMMVYGSGNTVIGTTNYLTLTINESILVSDAHSTEITESLYNQMVDRVTEFMDTVTDEISGKQDLLVSGVNIKTVNNNSLLGSGNINIESGVTGVKGNSESEYRTGNVNLTPANIGAQETLVSGTNIKTINNESILGAGNLVAAGDKFYMHTQGTPSDTWVIQHDLNKYPSVDVVDSAGSHVVGDVSYTDANELIVTFSAGFAGKAYLN